MVLALSKLIWGVGIDSDSPFTRQINSFGGITVILVFTAGQGMNVRPVVYFYIIPPGRVE